MPDIILYLLIGLSALLLGGGAGFWIGQSRGRSDAAKSTDLKRELDAYREQVSEHFGKTAEHFQALGLQVRELYDHMAVGAETLCDPAKTDKVIGFSATEALQQSTAPEAEEAQEEPEAEQAREPEAEQAQEPEAEQAKKREAEPAEESAGAEEPAATAGEPEESSFTVATPDEDDPDKRSYH